MMLWEPAGCEHGRGQSAESTAQAWTADGSAGNTCGTVCGPPTPQGRYPYSFRTSRRACLSVGAPLHRQFFYTGANCSNLPQIKFRVQPFSKGWWGPGAKPLVQEAAKTRELP